MPPLELEPFREEHLDDAAALLAARHARHRTAEPLLPEPGDVRAQIGHLLELDGASGAVALAGGRVVGYLLGAPRPDEVWGPNVWVELAGHAAEEPEIVRDLYAAAAEAWVAAGNTRHYALVPATDAALVDAWFRVGFGAQHAHGVREVPGRPKATAARIVVREAEERDVEGILGLAPLLNEHQALAPVFSAGHPLDDDDALCADIQEDLANPEVGMLVAEDDGLLVGHLAVVPVEYSVSHAGLSRPAGAALLAFAVTRPDRRGAGAGLALTEAALAWARDRGYGTIVTDWRETNLLASRFWPHRGWRRTFLRLHRSIP